MLRLLSAYQLQSGGCGLGGGAYPSFMMGGELPIGSHQPGLGGHGESLRRNRWRCRRGTAGGLTRRPNSSERGNHPSSFHIRPQPEGCGGDRRDVSRRRGWGGAVVVLRAWESHVHGEGRQHVSQGGRAKSIDAPVNTGAVGRPEPSAADHAVWRMQTKLPGGVSY